jgi:hypothetical protein
MFDKLGKIGDKLGKIHKVGKIGDKVGKIHKLG